MHNIQNYSAIQTHDYQWEEYQPMRCMGGNKVILVDMIEVNYSIDLYVQDMQLEMDHLHMQHQVQTQIKV